MKQLAVFLLTVGFLSHLTSRGYAQTDISIDVSAQVVGSVELLTVQSIQLSQAEAQNQIIRIDPRFSANAGKMIAIGSPNSNIRVRFIKNQQLTRQKGLNTLLFQYEVAVNTINDQATAELLKEVNRDFSFNSDGRLYIWIGGRVDVSAAAPGNYEGEFSIQITYI